MARFLCPVDGCYYIMHGRGKDLYTPPYAHCSLVKSLDDSSVNLGEGCVYPDVPEEMTYAHWLRGTLPEKQEEASDG